MKNWKKKAVSLALATVMMGSMAAPTHMVADSKLKRTGIVACAAEGTNHEKGNYKEVLSKDGKTLQIIGHGEINLMPYDYGNNQYIKTTYYENRYTVENLVIRDDQYGKVKTIYGPNGTNSNVKTFKRLPVKTLDISGCNSLNSIYGFNFTMLSKLNLKGKKELKNINGFSYTDIKNLDLTDNLKLEELKGFNGTLLKELNLKKNNNLKTLMGFNNTEINKILLPEKSSLVTIGDTGIGKSAFNNTKIEELDFSRSNKLQIIVGFNNVPLKKINLPISDSMNHIEGFNNTDIEKLKVGDSPNIEIIEGFNNTKIKKLELSKNPKVRKIDGFYNTEIKDLNIEKMDVQHANVNGYDYVNKKDLSKIAEARNKKYMEIASAKLNTSGATDESIKLASSKLNENKEKAFNSLKYVKTEKEINAITLNIKEAENLLVYKGEYLKRIKEVKIKEIEEISLNTPGMTAESIKKAERKLNELKKEGIKKVNSAKTEKDVFAVTINTQEAERLIETVKDRDARLLREAKQKKNKEIDLVTLNTKGMTNESIEKANSKLASLKKDAKKKVENSKTVSEVEEITVNKKEAEKYLETIEARNEREKKELEKAKAEKIKEIDRKKLNTSGMTTESIKKAERKLNELKVAAKRKVNMASNLGEVKAVSLNIQEAERLLETVKDKDARLLREAKQKKNKEIDLVTLNTKGMTKESIKEANSKLASLKKAAKKKVENSKTVSEVEKITVNKKEAEKYLETIEDFNALKKRKLNEINSKKLNTNNKTKKSIKAANERLETLKTAARKRLDSATSIKDIKEIKLDVAPSEKLLVERTNYKDGVTCIKGTWYYVDDGQIMYDYNGVKKNQYGWWKITKGKVDFHYNGYEKNEYGIWNIKNGKVDFGANGILKDNATGKWYLTRGGKVQTGTTTVAPNSYGWWHIKNGKVDFKSNTVAKNQYGWWKITGGKVNFHYNGFAKNNYGTWYLRNGKVDFHANGILRDNVTGNWYLTRGGKVQAGTTTVAPNAYGWWHIKNGKVDFKSNTVAKNQYGWWKITNGKVDFHYNGFAKNQYGTWYLRNGKVDFSYKA